MRAATGSSVLVAFGLEQAFGIPGTGGLTAYRVNLPVTGDLVGSESQSGQANPSGFQERGVPGARGGKSSWSLPMRAPWMLEFLEHLFGGVVKATVQAGPPAVYKYTFTPTLSGVDTSFYGLFSKPPVERALQFGIKFESLEMEIGDKEEVPVKLDGFLGHGTRLGVATRTETGSYDLGPHIRGPLLDPAAGSVHVRVTRVLESAGGLQFKVEQTTGSPTFPGTAVSVYIDPLTGRADWQNLQGSDGLDLGIWGENKDPLEIIFPGTAADHEDLDIGDTYEFPVTWADPAIPVATGGQRFTAAHWVTRFRPVGGGTWFEKRVNTGSFKAQWPVTVNQANASRYAQGMDRDGIFLPTFNFKRAFYDLFFADASDRHSRVELQMAFEGRQLGTGAHRESLTLTAPSVGIGESKRVPGKAQVVEEEVSLTGETNDAGDPPLTIEVITTRNWTPTS
jgi:hypothetical protein